MTKSTESLNLSLRKNLGLVGKTYARRERPENEALPPQINKMEGRYGGEPEGYYRNKGNAHIKSYGVPC